MRAELTPAKVPVAIHATVALSRIHTMGLGVDGSVDFERLARVAIEAVRNNPQPAGLNS